MKIVFVNHDRFDSESGGHIARYAARLHAMGHAVSVLAEGDPEGAAEFGPTPFHTAPRDHLAEAPEAALAFDGEAPDPCDTLVHAWTPREAVREAVGAARRRASFHTVVHLESDETVLTGASLGRSWTDLSLMEPAQLDPLVSADLAHPHRMNGFLHGAAAATATVAPLLSFAAGGPVHVLQPGCDLQETSPHLRPDQRAALLDGLHIPREHKIVVYPGDLHAANRRELQSLYVAMQILRRRGVPVTLVRTGEDRVAPLAPALDHLSGRVSRELGRLPRGELMVLMRLADLFVQPGAPDAFNLCRLPARLPQFFAAGAPVLLPRANLGQMIDDGVEAVALDRGDGVEIADRAEPLLRDPARAAAMGEAGRAFIARTLNWDRSVCELERFYREVLALRAPRHGRQAVA